MKVAVAGGTSSIGRAIADGLGSHGGHEYIILSRRPHPSIKTVIVDYDDVEGLTTTLETEQVQAVISGISISDKASGKAQLSLIEAAKRSKCTTRFVPSEFGMMYRPDNIDHIPSYSYKIKAEEALEKTDLEFSFISNGVFLDYWAAPRIPTHLPHVLPIWLDFANNFAALPGDGSATMVWTHTRDVGHFIAAMLDLPSWERRYSIIGNRLRLNDAVRIAEEVKGVKFKVHYDAVETLRQGKMTLTPRLKEMIDSDPEAYKDVSATVASSGVRYLQGDLDLDPKKSLNNLFPELKPLSVRDVAKAWRE